MPTPHDPTRSYSPLDAAIAGYLQAVEAGQVPDRQAWIVLKHCQGWTLAQIAERIGRSSTAVASLLRRGLEELRSRLGVGGKSCGDA